MGKIFSLLKAEQRAAKAAADYRKANGSEFSFGTDTQTLKDFLAASGSKILSGERFGGKNNSPYLVTTHGVCLWLGKSLLDAGITTGEDVRQNHADIMVSCTNEGFFSLFRTNQSEAWDL